MEHNTGRGAKGRNDRPSPRLEDLMDKFEFGPCCHCGGTNNVRNVIMLELRSPEPGIGCWGCVQCGAEQAGAISVICDGCARDPDFHMPKQAILGSPHEGRRIDLTELKEPFGHDLSKHPEI
jgi:hypothetical protein